MSIPETTAGRISTRLQSWTAAQWFCLLGGTGLLFRGAFGLSMTEFGAPSDGWHQVFHFSSGVLLIFAFTCVPRARFGALAFGVVYAAFSILGAAGVDGILGLIETDMSSTILHGVYAAIALGVWALDRRQAPRRGRAG